MDGAATVEDELGQALAKAGPDAASGISQKGELGPGTAACEVLWNLDGGQGWIEPPTPAFQRAAGLSSALRATGARLN